MYLIDTNVISEIRKGRKANRGVRKFFRKTLYKRFDLYLSVITVGELSRGVELIRHRGDIRQAALLEDWLSGLLRDYADHILPFDTDMAQVWGKLRSPHSEHLLDKQIAATALVYDLTVLTRNTRDFEATGVRILNPFE
ncbi:PilT domain-containing protein [Salinisphaera sp. PC39]|uniref:type II toxin-antitoxin system VapC family toxin n=1 Tax=Salinisphaera sp. PC39 TaxID=1304156 RepID=UPI00333EF08A